MATTRGFFFGEIKPQPGFTATKDERGGWTGTHNFAVLRSSMNAATRAAFAKGTSITTLDSSLPSFYGFLKVVESETLFDEGDFTMIRVTLSGAQGAQYGDDGLSEDAEPTYRLSGQLQDAPLSLHPKWEALEDIEKAALGLLIRGQAEFDLPTGKVGQYSIEDETFYAIKNSDGVEMILESEDGIAFATRISRGESTYLRPTFTWTESIRGTDELSATDINKLGNIAEPRGNPPTPNGTRDWMLTSAFQEETGDLITTDLEWTLSEKGGHDSFLYEE